MQSGFGGCNHLLFFFFRLAFVWKLFGTGLCAELAQVLQSPENLGRRGNHPKREPSSCDSHSSKCYAGYLINTWNLKNDTPVKRRFLLETDIFRFHVTVRESLSSSHLKMDGWKTFPFPLARRRTLRWDSTLWSPKWRRANIWANLLAVKNPRAFLQTQQMGGICSNNFLSLSGVQNPRDIPCCLLLKIRRTWENPY